ncbi:MAG: DNA primase [bacterium]
MAGIISKSVLDDIRFRCDIVDVIDSYITLPRKGTIVKALCPFHKEKTPSFNVNRQRQIFHCFGCGVGGDVFKFVMLYEHVDFPGAIKILAEKAGVPIQFEKGSEPSGDKEILLAIHEEAAALFHRQLLQNPDALAAREYLKKRQLSPEVIEDFMIGYAPDSWDFLIDWARKKEYPVQKLDLAGLVVKRDEDRGTNPYYDRFRGRIMFPIRNEQGRIVAFSGRTLLQDPKAAKYVNSPETPLFRKSHILYALDRARREIVETREAIICEGQIDVIRCHQAGFKTAVAAQGTAFTEDHARILKRYADGVVLVFDSDDAGRNAALKASVIFMQMGLAVRVATLPQGEDPDSLILKQGAPAFAKAISQAVPAIEFQLTLLLGQEDIRTEVGMMKVSRAVLATISQSPNAVQRDVLIQTVARRLGVSTVALHTELRLLTKHTAPRIADSDAPLAAPQRPISEVLLAEHLGTNPDLVTLAELYLPFTMITDPTCRAFLEVLRDSSREGVDVMQLLTDRDDADRNLSTFAAQVLSAPHKAGTEGSDRQAVEGLILGLWSRELQRRRTLAEQQLSSVEENIARDELLAQAAQLTTDINRLKRWETGEAVLKFYVDTPAIA